MLNFSRILEKDGFSKMHRNMYVRYCTTLNNALKHKSRIQNQIFEKSKVNIFLIGDKQCEYAYHYYGPKSKKKGENLLKKPLIIEFF